MQVLTPSGYVSPSALANGAEVCAFDLTTGAPIINHVENIDFVDYEVWCRWWEVEDTVPPFNWVRVNGDHVLFCEQSVWRNGINVCHARDIIVGDVIHDGSDVDLLVNSIEWFEDRDAVWYRFDVSNDHSYIVDDITVHNANRFWVLGTGTWDSSTTTHWGSATGSGAGGPGGASVPGSADAAVFDANSDLSSSTHTATTVTVNFGGSITIQSINLTGFGNSSSCTWDNSVNNNNFTLNLASGTAFSGSNTSGTRTISLGSATYTISGAGSALWNFTSVTGVTLNAGSSTITFSGATNANKAFIGGGKSYGTINLSASTSSAFWNITGANTFAALTVTAPNYVQFAGTTTTTVTAAVAINGSLGSWVGFFSSVASSSAGLTVGAGSAFSWCSFRDITFSGSPTTQNCVDLGNNAGATIGAPMAAGPVANAPIVVARGTPY